MPGRPFALVPAAYVFLLRRQPVRPGTEEATSAPGAGRSATGTARASTSSARVPDAGASSRCTPRVSATGPRPGRSQPGGRAMGAGTAPARAIESAANTQVLLQLRQNTGYMDGYWACGIAGHVEPAESVMATALREAREETGVLLTPYHLEPLTSMHRSADLGGAALEQRIDFFFTARSWSGEPRVLEPGKAAQMAWFGLDALPGPVPPHERVVLDQLAAALDGGARVPTIQAFGFNPGPR